MRNFTYACRKFLCVVLLMNFFSEGNTQQIAKSLTASNGTFIGFYEYKPTDYDPSGNYKYPVIIFLHGIGERGNGTTELPRVKTQALPRYIDRGHKMKFYWNGKWETFIVLSPQLNSKYGSWQQFYTREMVDYAKQHLNIDTNRIILTGLSLGGGGVWNYASASLANAKQFAAIAPICGTCSISNACNIANANLPVWTEHASNDPTVSVNCTINANNAINNCNPSVKPIQFIHPDGKHVIWNRAYDTVYKWHEPNIYEWFLGQNKSLPANKLPKAVAGGDASVYLENGNANLTATNSIDTDGKIVKFIWKGLSGPTVPVIASKNEANTVVSALTTAGTYSFELTVVDNRTGWSKDTFNVSVAATPVAVNKAPVANAGPDQIVKLPINSVSLDGTLSNDIDGTLSSFSWTKISGPSANIEIQGSSKTNISSLIEGIYIFQLEVTDDGGAASTDQVQVTVLKAPNELPVADAGSNKSITLPINYVELNASNSSDTDGTISQYKWNMILGGVAVIENATNAVTKVSGLVAGTHKFELIVTDNDGGSSRDTVRVIVNEAVKPVNLAPIANAGKDQYMTLPLNSANLDASASKDPDGSISAYSWTFISGPTAINLVNPAQAITKVTGLQAGTYKFQLQVTDNLGSKGSDTLNISVVRAPNKIPLARAGKDTLIYYPQSSIELDASQSLDLDGQLVQYSWSQISGPSEVVIEQPGQAKTIASRLFNGEYQFRLDVEDDRGGRSSDTVLIKVVNNLRYEEKLEVYPNPTRGPLTVNVTSEFNGTSFIRILDNYGKHLFFQTFTKESVNKKIVVETLKLPPGIYYVEYDIQANKRMVTRFIKQ